MPSCGTKQRFGKIDGVTELQLAAQTTKLSNEPRMSQPQSVNYQLNQNVATIMIDDGKRNALSPAVLRSIYAALRQAEKDQATVILTGREGVFSAGFDLKVMKAAGPDALRMLRAGYSLTAVLMAHPTPVITACPGHAFAMGVFAMLSTDYIIGCRGDFQISANEVEIGLTMPRVGSTTLRNRLTPAAFQRAVALSEYFTPDSALQAGFFDELVEPDQLMARARELAQKFSELDGRAHAASKRRIRAEQISGIRRQVPLDLVDAVKFGLRGGKPKR